MTSAMEATASSTSARRLEEDPGEHGEHVVCLAVAAKVHEPCARLLLPIETRLERPCRLASLPCLSRCGGGARPGAQVLVVLAGCRGGARHAQQPWRQVANSTTVMYPPHVCVNG